jgi:hypothetical protein
MVESRPWSALRVYTHGAAVESEEQESTAGGRGEGEKVPAAHD